MRVSLSIRSMFEIVYASHIQLNLGIIISIETIGYELGVIYWYYDGSTIEPILINHNIIIVAIYGEEIIFDKYYS